MKRVLIELLAVVVLASCGGKKMQDPFAVMAQLPEPDVPVADSLFVKEVLKPLEADELFDDFIFNYALDKTLQKQRTRFPLPYLAGDTVKTIEEKEWKHTVLEVVPYTVQYLSEVKKKPYLEDNNGRGEY